MLKKLLAVVALVMAIIGFPSAKGLYEPYAKPEMNFMYNLLFFDDRSLFKNSDKEVGDIWETLLADQPNNAALHKIASDENNEGRMRALAYNRLRLSGEAVPQKQVLGVIVEVPLEEGLDVMAAFSEGGVRYLNRSEIVGVYEGSKHPLEGLAKELIAIAQPVVNQLGPWKKQRLPPPLLGNIRITFLVSDGLYFGEGEFGEMYQDALAGPVISKARELLLRAVEVQKKANVR
jgi:hypothetical protein